MNTSQKIHFFSLKKNFRVPEPARTRKIINKILASKKKKLESLNLVFCSDAYLLKINRDYLGHDFFTDIITFNLADPGKPIIGEIFISIDRVRDNARTLKISSKNELSRVIIHGALHLGGLRDKTKAEKVKMRALENRYLSQF
ncbi:MAG TPA: rRNA maturation RNase YbeY [Chitinophagaceae bacterium]|nr:rRNA maturation RNase YbeY [Chitinophagaceae bacterium]